MSAPTTVHPGITAAIDQGLAQFRSQTAGRSAGGSSTSAVPVDLASTVAGQIAAGVADAFRSDPKLLTKTKQKDFTVNATLTPDVVAMKGFWDDLGSIANQLIPVVIGALGGAKAFQQGQVTVPERLQNDKDFWDFLGSTLQTVVPQIIGAVTGDKAFEVSSTPMVPPGKDKDWFSDAMGVVGKVLPTVLPLVLAAI